MRSISENVFITAQKEKPFNNSTEGLGGHETGVSSLYSVELRRAVTKKVSCSPMILALIQPVSRTGGSHSSRTKIG